MAKAKRTMKPQAKRGKPPRSKAGGAGAPYRVFVRDLVLPARIGIHPHERELAQRVCLNVDLVVTETGAAASDDIATVVSYEDIVFGVKRIIGEGHIGLVETLAERVASLCLTDPRVLHARIRVEKIDVFKEAASVGVEIERSAKRRGRR